MRTYLILIFSLFFLQGKAQWINSLSIYPQFPSPTDSVYLLADCSFPSASCDQHTKGATVSGNTVSAWALHCVGMLAVICDHVDSINLGTLPAGIYTANFQLDHGFGNIPCTPGIVAGPNSSITFQVAVVTNLPSPSEQSNGFSFYPNPVHDLLHVKINKASQASPSPITLYNLIGEKIWESNEVLEEYTIETKNWKPGIYVLKKGFQSYKIDIR